MEYSEISSNLNKQKGPGSSAQKSWTSRKIFRCNPSDKPLYYSLLE